MSLKHATVKRLSLIVLSLLCLQSVLPQLASAQDASPTAATDAETQPLPLFAIYPKDTRLGTFFNVEQGAGTTENYTVVLINAGTEENGPFDGRTFAVDGRTKVNGGLESGGPDDPKTGLTTWLDYPNEDLTLEPGKGIERTFSVTVPEDTAPGQYVTALCFETAEPLPIPGVDNVTQNLRQTIAFYLTVPGPDLLSRRSASIRGYDSAIPMCDRRDYDSFIASVAVSVELKVVAWSWSGRTSETPRE